MIDHCRSARASAAPKFCQDAAYLEGFCRFHYDALKAGEINELGVISELLSDQNRRREINFHGLGTKPRATSRTRR